MVPAPTADQFSGCVLGLALGDALGAAVEAFPPPVAEAWALGLSPLMVPDVGPGGWAFGQVTDDTQLSRELLRSIADTGRFDPATFAERLRALVESGQLVGGGPATVAAARQLALGIPWHQCGMPSPYAGNGAAMRAGPLGLLYRHDPRRLTQVAVDQARVTHQDARAIAGAVAIAWAVAIASRRAPIVVEEFLEEIALATGAIDPGFATTLQLVEDWVGLTPALAAETLARQGLEPEVAGGWQGVSSHVVSSVCWSLFAFLRHPESWWEAVRVAIAVGGDTDTIASMTGAIAGARLGAPALPQSLLGRLRDGGTGVAADLALLSRRVERLATIGEVPG